MDHLDPVGEGMGKACDQILERPFLEATVAFETVVGDMAKIRLRLLHHWHVEEHSGLADLVVGAKAADAPWRRGDDRCRLLVEDALPIRPRPDVDRILEDTGNSAIIFGAAEQHAVGLPNLLAKADPLLGR